MIIDFVFMSLLFLPGILLMFILSERIKTKLNILEKILFGATLWNYVFVVSSVLTGLFTTFVIQYFRFFTAVSGLIVLLSIVFIFTIKRQDAFKITFKNNHLTVIKWTVFFCLLIFSFFSIYFHTIFYEWDAVYCYIPSAKGIILSGGITSQPYRLLNFFDVSPSLPLMYAWIIEYSNIDGLYTLPIAFFILTLTAIWLISRRFFSVDMELVPVLIFMSLPTVTLTLSSRVLYLDMAFLLYMLITFYTLIRIVDEKCHNEQSSFLFVMFALSFTLMFLTRIEFGLLLMFSILAAIISLMKIKFWRLISVFVLGIPYYIREARNIILSPASWTYYSQRIVPIIIISLLILTILRIQKKTNEKLVLRKQSIFFIAFITPLIIYTAHNILYSGFLASGWPIWNTDVLKAAIFFNKIQPSPQISLDQLLRWDNLFSVWWFISPFIIPFLIAVLSSIYSLIKKREMSFNVSLLFFFFGVFILWSQLGCDPQPRRLYYMAPFAALVIAFGFCKLKKFYNFQAYLIRVLTYTITITSIVWIKNDVKTFKDLSLLYAYSYQPKMDLELLAIAIMLFFVIFLPYETLMSKIKQEIRFSERSATMALLSVLILNVIIFSVFATPIILDAANKGLQSKYLYYGNWFYYPDVVNFYNENITDDYTTLGFYCNELITFANRKVIDLYLPIYASPIYSIIENNNCTQILELLRKLNVRYFLQPKPNNWFYETYEKLISSTVLGSILSDNPQLRLLKTFKYANLYKFYENYTIQTVNYSWIGPWNCQPGTNYTLTIEQNVTRFSGTTNSDGRLSVMYSLSSPLKLEEALWLTVKSYNQSKLVVILFSNLQNRTTDFFSYQCSLTNQTRKPVINLKEGTTKGNFNPNHIEAILIGIETQPNTTQTFEIHQISTITYNNQC